MGDQNSYMSTLVEWMSFLFSTNFFVHNQNTVLVKLTYSDGIVVQPEHLLTHFMDYTRICECELFFNYLSG